MKTRLLLLAAALIFSGRLFGSGEFHLSMKDRSEFYVFFDGEIFDPNGSVLRLYDVIPGLHTVDVYRYIRNAKGYATKYAELVYRGTYRTEAKAGVEVVITPDGRLITKSRWALTPPPPKGHNGAGKGNNSYHGTGGKGSGSTGYNSHYGAKAMSTHEFGSLVATIRSASFEQTKLTIAKDAIARSLVTSDMVYQIMMLFSFEATKLEFAKWAYAYTTDPHLYYLVNRAFSFDSSKTELSRWISLNG
ncbi:MAG TPA: DUF4476 domain-containing protein [Bacteroidales bacterium]|nr:DUF4476 domain-containing protein [Bacteroidales bacterium]HRZ49468.1 DUF4476 domain-containing protein [Bacteroidales bacterium]